MPRRGRPGRLGGKRLDEQSLLDPVALGRSIRAARVVIGRSVPELTDILSKHVGRPVTERMVYSYERGEALPPLDVWAALILEFGPTCAGEWLVFALRPDAGELLQSLVRGAVLGTARATWPAEDLEDVDT